MSYIPVKDPSFCQNDLTSKLEKILDFGRFFPILIVGETGVGKTFPVEQTCSKLNKPCIRVNLSKRSTEDNLIGHYTLHEGDTIYEYGPCIKAMEMGAVLLLDEIDAADAEEILCLQSIMEGSGYYIKALNKMILPAEGFTIIATANTKGLGDETGKYVGTNILNEAFLERFIAVFEVDYLKPSEEYLVLTSFAKEYMTLVPDGFIKKLIKWANEIRDSKRNSNELDHNISTRRLTHILKTFEIFKDERTSIEICLDRFDSHHKAAFFSFYNLTNSEEETENYISSFENKFKTMKPIT